MRPIKFRGKSLKTGEWFYGNLYDKDTYGRTHICTTRGGCLCIDPDTVGQYTGLKDCNGKEIYEGDVVRISTRLKQAEKEAQERLSDAIGIKPPGWTYGGDEIARVSYFDCAFHFIITESYMPRDGCWQEPMLCYLYSERHPDEPESYRTEIEVIGNIHDKKAEE